MAGPGRLKPPLAGRLFDGRPFTWAFACPLTRPLTEPLAEPVPTRPGVTARVLIVRTGMCEAAAAGAVRAITWRFCTAVDGLATRAPVLAAPKWLCCAGLTPGLLVTFAPRNEASVTCTAPRLILCPLVNALREATVTARVLCAYA